MCARVAAVIMVVSAGAAAGQPTVVQFNGNLNSPGPGSMSFATGGAQANSAFGTDTINGNSSGVLTFAAVFGSSANRGLFLDTGVGPNGGGDYINQYTLMYDLKVGPDYGWCSLFQTNDANTNDGDAFIRALGDGGGIGIAGQYHGTILEEAWHRIALVVDQSNNLMSKYIDGVHVGDSTLSGGTDGRWSLYSTNDAFFNGLFILADESGDMTDGSINSFLFDDELYSADVIGQFGGASSGGLPTPGAAALMGLGGLVAARRRR